MRVVVYVFLAILFAFGIMWGCSSGGPTNTTTNTIATTSAGATTTVPITNRRPDANPGGPYEGLNERPLRFDGSGSTGATQLNYFWDFGDNSGAEGRGPFPTHTYGTFCFDPDDPTARTFTITLRVRDDNGQEDTDTTTALIRCTY